ncbi:MAG: HAMP domain-containing sensor histidine kinase [Desulfomonilia bacterium]|nr:HAMP domain-containing sensor histidine kinase [Desulfomonilia bacterium]
MSTRQNTHSGQGTCVSEEFVANLVHDLKSPAISIGGYARRLLSGRCGPLSSDQRHALDIIIENCIRLEQDLENILEHFRGEQDLESSSSRKHVELCALLRFVVENFAVLAEDKDIDLRLDLPDTPLEIMAKERQIELSIANLITNAIKYTSKGGSVTVSARAEGDSVVIRVKDTGKGFPEERIEQLFQPFEKVLGIEDRELRGVGLGLSNVRSYVERHGGKIQVESEEGKGSVFTIYLPRSLDPHA